MHEILLNKYFMDEEVLHKTFDVMRHKPMNKFIRRQ